jgi:hypothetical protein
VPRPFSEIIGNSLFCNFYANTIRTLRTTA